MADGISVYLADKWLQWLAGSAETAPSALYVALHIGDPGTAGTTNPASVTTRVVMTLGTAASGAIAANGTLPSWTSWAGTNGQVITDISIWDASTAGNFLDSIQLTSSVTMDTGDTLDLSSLSISFTTAS
jgi:hypothetical protein